MLSISPNEISTAKLHAYLLGSVAPSLLHLLAQ